MTNKQTGLWLVGLAVSLGACREMPISGPEGGVDATSPTNDTSTGNDGSTNPTDTNNQTNNDGSTGNDGGATTRTVSVAQTQNFADPQHPPLDTTITLSDQNLVALSPRMIIDQSSSTVTLSDGGRATLTTSCRIGVWIGNPAGGDFMGIHIQDNVFSTDAGLNCFSVNSLIPSDIAPGQIVSAVDRGTYEERCEFSGFDAGSCRSFESTRIYRPRTFTVGAQGTAPTPTPVTVADIGQVPSNNAVGARAVALEGTLVRIDGARLRLSPVPNTNPARFDYDLVDPSASPDAGLNDLRAVRVSVSNISFASCGRAFLDARDGQTIGSVTGILTPLFSRWTIRVRTTSDISGTACGTDGGTSTDAGSTSDVATD